MKSSINRFLFLVPLLLLLILNSTCLGQSVWADQKASKSIVGVELMIPSVEDQFAIEFPTSVVLLYSRFRINDALSIKIDLPVSHLSTGNDISETDLGNPYLGLGLHNVSSGLDMDIGLRLPFAPEFDPSQPEANLGLTTGMLIENYNFGIYLPETFSFTSNLKYQWNNESGLIIKTGGGPDYLIPNGSAENELLLNYYGQVLYGAENYSIGAGLTGLLIVTEEDVSFGDRTIHDLGLIGNYNFENARLGAYLRVPLDDDLNDTLSFVFGLNIALRI